jgi:hypothetical protein
MKKNMAFALIILLFFSMPAACLQAAYTKAQITQYWMNLCKTAKTDAEKETSGLLWMGAGCLFNGLGVIGAYFVKVAPPAERLIGKPAAYAAQYTKCYEQRAVDIQTGNAWTGCGISAALTIVSFLGSFLIF